MNAPLYTPADRAEYERKKAEWGESGPTIFIQQERSDAVDADLRTTIVLNHKGFVPKNQTEQQKFRTFVEA